MQRLSLVNRLPNLSLGRLASHGANQLEALALHDMLRHLVHPQFSEHSQFPKGSSHNFVPGVSQLPSRS